MIATILALAASCPGISPASENPLASVRVAAGLTLPVFVTSPPGDLQRLFVVEQDGRIRLLKNGVLQTTPFLDLSASTWSPGDVQDGSANEQGLLGLAFHPDYATNGWFFVYHTDNTQFDNVLERYERSQLNPDVADPTSGHPVLRFAHPGNKNHNGGMLAFGPDGKLYVGTGDGGAGCDPPNNAQNRLSRLGKLLRIDVDTLPYAIPPDNPFAGNAAYAPEIWALGLRNPWRWSFDRENGDLYIGDVGQNEKEEIDYRAGAGTGGENYGWDVYEGSTCPSACGGSGCALASYVAPVWEYDHPAGCSITGGYVYRGCRMPGLRGTYFYADFCAAFVKSFRIATPATQTDRTAQLAPGGGLSLRNISSFGEDARGELYVLDRPDGELFKIVPSFPNLEVSGPGAAPLRPEWTWEDLQATTSYPIASYRIYRQDARQLPFVCVRRSATPSWPGGDPARPNPGSVFAYVVTAVSSSGAETSPGTGTGGAARVLAATACP